MKGKLFLMGTVFFIGNTGYSQQYWPSQYIFFEEFNGNEINEEFWHPGPSFIGGNSSSVLDFDNNCNYPDFNCFVDNLECYASENVLVNNGICELRSTYHTDGFVCDNGFTKYAKSGMIVSKRRFKYGTFEARIKMDVGDGFWPAFWLFGCDDPGSNTCGEIDIFEINTASDDKFTNNWHRFINGGNSDDLHGFDFDGDFTIGCLGTNNWNDLNMNGNTITQWHDYKVIWGPGVINYYIDNILIRTESIDIPESAHLILNVAIYGAEDDLGNCVSEYLARGGPNASDFPHSMEIDFVRVTPLLECVDLDFCEYFQSFGHDPTSYFAENIYVGGQSTCNFSYEHSINYASEVMDFRATTSIILKPGFNAPQGSVFTAKIVPDASIICDFPFFIQDTSDISYRRYSNSNVGDMNFSSEITVYPNPATNYVKIFYPENELVELIKVFNSLGEQLFSSAGSVNEIDFTNWSPGVYFLEMKTDKGIYRNKIIRQ